MKAKKANPTREQNKRLRELGATHSEVQLKAEVEDDQGNLIDPVAETLQSEAGVKGARQVLNGKAKTCMDAALNFIHDKYSIQKDGTIEDSVLSSAAGTAEGGVYSVFRTICVGIGRLKKAFSS